MANLVKLFSPDEQSQDKKSQPLLLAEFLDYHKYETRFDTRFDRHEWRLVPMEFESDNYEWQTRTDIFERELANNLLRDNACSAVQDRIDTRSICGSEKTLHYNLNLLDDRNKVDSVTSRLDYCFNLYDCKTAKHKELIAEIAHNQSDYISVVPDNDLSTHNTSMLNFVYLYILASQVLLSYEAGTTYCDMVPIFVGPEGIGKSSYCREVVKPLHPDLYHPHGCFDTDPKLIREKYDGCGLVEVPEGKTMDAKNFQNMRAIITTGKFTARKAYRRNEGTTHRTWIWVATVNDMQCLPRTDQKHRRFLPVHVEDFNAVIEMPKIPGVRKKLTCSWRQFLRFWLPSIYGYLCSEYYADRDAFIDTYIKLPQQLEGIHEVLVRRSEIVNATIDEYIRMFINEFEQTDGKLEQLHRNSFHYSDIRTWLKHPEVERLIPDGLRLFDSCGRDGYKALRSLGYTYKSVRLPNGQGTRTEWYKPA